MGNCFQPIDNLGDESTWTYETCRCMDNQGELVVATYRCEYITNEYLDNEAPRAYPQLRKYWRSTSGSLGQCYQYIGCEKCMTEDMKPLFTYHSNGWKSHCKVHTDYEPIKFSSS